MKIMVLADEPAPILWEYLDRRKLEGVELILSCGDLPASYLSFLTCFTHAPILYIHGNHDGSYEKTPPEGCICIDGTVYVHNGIRIAGLGGCMRYNRGSFQYTEGQMRRRLWRLLPRIAWHRGVDILVTHAPAFGLGDDKDLTHRGFKCFVSFMDRFHPHYLVHGHVHQSYRFDFKRTRTYQQTEIINACGYYIFDYPD